MTEIMVAALVAVVPGVAALYLGRPITSADPRLLGLYRARRKQLAQLTLAVIVSLAMFYTAHAFWAIPLALAARGLGWFRARRNLLGERWGPLAYAAHSLRVAAVGYAFWVLLYAAPIIVIWYPPYGTALWPLFAVALICWIRWSTPITLVILRARPLEQPELVEAFGRVSANARGPRPSVWRAGPKGGRWTTAMSLPDAHRPAVLFSESVLAQLDPDELAAIYAHEVAHLEHADIRYLHGYRSWTGALVTVSVLLPLVPIDRSALLFGWTLLLSTVVVWRVRSGREEGRRRETQCDADALRFGASPHALERALVKIHSAALIPEQWSTRQARVASHPSLVQRVADIRRVAGAGKAAAGG